MKKELAQDLQEDSEGVIFIETELKMSDVVLDFIAPYEAEAETIEQARVLIGIAVFAWNAAMLPSDEHKHALQVIFESMPDADRKERKEMQVFFNALVKRKQRHFAHIKRSILSYELIETRGGGWHLTVASNITPEEAAREGYTPE